jgi:hypothetical protein
MQLNLQLLTSMEIHPVLSQEVPEIDQENQDAEDPIDCTDAHCEDE